MTDDPSSVVRRAASAVVDAKRSEAIVHAKRAVRS